MKNFIDWIKTSFEDDNGHASHRKLTTFAFTMFVKLMIILTFIKGDPNLFPELVWMSIIAGALGMSYLRSLGYKKIKDEDN